MKAADTARTRKRDIDNPVYLATMLTPAIVVLGGTAFSFIGAVAGSAASGSLSELFKQETLHDLLYLPMGLALFYVFLLCVNVFAGLPAYFLLRRLGAANLYTCTAFGLAAGFVGDYISMHLHRGGPIPPDIALLSFTGGIYGLIFWVLADRGRSDESETE